MIWTLLFACVAPRPELSFDGRLETSACEDIQDLVVPVDRLWLQQPALASVWSPIATAHAHPGHDPAGDVTGELLGPWTLSPCSDPVFLGTGRGYEGAVGSGQLVLQGEAHLEATLDGMPVAITTTVDAPVAGLPLDGQLVDGIHAVLTFDPWLTLSVLPTEDTDGDGLLTEHDDGVAEALRYGLTNPNTWTLSLETP